LNVLIMLGNASKASLAVFTPQRLPYHAVGTEVCGIELPQAQQLVNDGLLLRSPSKFWDVARVMEHAAEIEVHHNRVADGKGGVGEWIAPEGACSY
jgi:hypothetical protein